MRLKHIKQIYKEDGLKTYAVIINVVGIENDLLLYVGGTSEQEAKKHAIEKVCMIKENDMEIKIVREII